MTTRLSVLIPVHNGETYAGKAIRSILAQSFRDLELVVLDDGSTDNSARVARAFGDSRVRVYRRDEHEGVAATRNHLLIAARAPLIAFLDADDVAFPDRLTQQVAFLERHRDVALVSCGYIEIDAQGQNVRQRVLPHDHEALSSRLLHDNVIPSSTIVVRREALDAAGGFDTSIDLATEYDLVLQIAEKSRVAALGEPLVKVRMHARALSYARRLEQREALDEARRRAVRRRHMKELELPTVPPIEATPVAAVDNEASHAGLRSAGVTEIRAPETDDLVTAATEAGAADDLHAEPDTAVVEVDERQGQLFVELAASTTTADETCAAATQPAPDDPQVATDSRTPDTTPLVELAASADPESAPSAEIDDNPPRPDLPPTAPVIVAIDRDALVAVVIPTSGREALESVRSVLDQNLKELMVAVVTTIPDQGLERGLELLGDDRVLLLEAPGVSRARALNLGVLGTRSRYIAYLSDTSLYRREHLQQLVEFAENERLGFAYSDLGLATPAVPGATVMGRDFDAAELLKENYIPTEAVLHRRALLHEVGLFNEGLEEGMEWELWVFLTRVTPARRLPKTSVERVVRGERASRLVAPSPTRVRRYLAERFNGRQKRAEPQAVLPEEHGIHAKGFLSGEWATAAADFFERQLTSLTSRFVHRYPERDIPSNGTIGNVDAHGPVVSSRPRPQAPEEAPNRAPLMRAPSEMPVPHTHQAALAPSLVQAPPALTAEPAASEELPLPASAPPSPEPTGHSNNWLYTRTGIIPTGRARGASGLRSSGHLSGRPRAVGAGIGNRKKALAALVQTPDCPHCTAPDPILACRAGWYRVFDCQSCGLAFSNPRLDPSLSVRFFADRRPENVPPNIRSVADIPGTPFDRTRELGWVHRHVPHGRLVDIGASWGYTLLQAQNAGYEVSGTELSRTLARTARDRFKLDVEERELVDLAYETASLDAITALHVVQHFLDPRALFTEAARVLRPGGVLVVSVPNFDSYLRELLGKRWRWLDPESQPFHFRPASLAAELTNAGFEIEMWTSEGSYGDTALLEFIAPEELQEVARAGRGSELGAVAIRR